MKKIVVPVRFIWTFWVLTITCGFTVATTAQAQDASQQSPVFRSGVTLITTDVIVRDSNGQFLPDLTVDNFVVYEDGQPQEIASLVLVNGGRVYDQLLPAAPVQEGIVLPNSRPGANTPGRIFVLFIDDMHLSSTDTPKVQAVLELLKENLIHEGDMFGVVSSGRSSIRVPMTYDRDELEQAVRKVVGEALSPRELVDMTQGDSGRRENRWRANVAFKVARQTVRNLMELQNRRKVFLYVSGGYDFDPFTESRAMADIERMANIGVFDDTGIDIPDLRDPNTLNSFSDEYDVFNDADLQQELLLLTTEANRANVSFYTIDPRGLSNAMDLDFDLTGGLREWNEYLRTQQGSMRTLAELTGGIAVVNRNTFEDAFKEIDAETSDYYVLGFYSNNPDPTHKVRQLRVEVNREEEEVDVRARTHYVLPAETTR